MRRLWIVAALCISTSVASADATVSLGSLTADGVRLDDVSCTLDGAGLFGGLAVVATLSKQRAAIDACAPEPLRFAMALTFRGGRTSARISDGGTAAQRACLERALARASATVEGRCTAVLRTGPQSTDRAAPARAGRRAFPTLAELRALYGQPTTSPTVRGLLAAFDDERELYPSGSMVYWSYKRRGLSILWKDGRLTTIFLYAQGADGFDAWPGDLPSGLTLRDTRADVEARLGKPAKTGGEGVIDFWADYRDGIHVTYASKSTTSMTSRVHHLALTAN
jgi:hypothetical protein